MKHAQLVMGPAGCGKSTYCKTIQDHCDSLKRTLHVVNLDPAADTFHYNVSFDIRDLVTLEDVMEELEMGPNGGLVYCMEYLIENLDEWLAEQIKDYNDDYLIFDCPGQIELYSHVPVMKIFTQELQRLGYQVCGVYCVDVQFVDDPAKFISGTMMCLSAMVQFEMPHINVLTKCDILDDQQRTKLEEEYLIPDIDDLVYQLDKRMSRGTAITQKYSRLNQEIGNIISQYSMVAYVPLNIEDESSIEFCLSTIDNAIQYGEDLEVKEPKENDQD
ncbi:gpn3 [Acrasis kona]|uniref:GPN-loop GTPase 3 n=1 Tax=Acrasis kona TaxID=1008807 RepID=A0AAW2YJA0_9EUKA